MLLTQLLNETPFLARFFCVCWPLSFVFLPEICLDFPTAPSLRLLAQPRRLVAVGTAPSAPAAEYSFVASMRKT